MFQSVRLHLRPSLGAQDFQPKWIDYRRQPLCELYEHFEGEQRDLFWSATVLVLPSTSLKSCSLGRLSSSPQPDGPQWALSCSASSEDRRMILFRYWLTIKRPWYAGDELEPIAVLASEGMLGTLSPVTLKDIFPFFQDKVELSCSGEREKDEEGRQETKSDWLVSSPSCLIGFFISSLSASDSRRGLQKLQLKLTYTLPLALPLPRRLGAQTRRSLNLDESARWALDQSRRL
jgi:hypothetical protein